MPSAGNTWGSNITHSNDPLIIHVSILSTVVGYFWNCSSFWNTLWRPKVRITLHFGSELIENTNRPHARGDSCIVWRRTTPTRLGTIGWRRRDPDYQSEQRGRTTHKADRKVDRLFSGYIFGFASELWFAVDFPSASGITTAAAGIHNRISSINQNIPLTVKVYFYVGLINLWYI
jgi:hypothetical protein